MPAALFGRGYFESAGSEHERGVASFGATVTATGGSRAACGAKPTVATVLMAQQGFTAPEVAICTGFSPRSVQEWVARYNREGLSGLANQTGTWPQAVIDARGSGTIETTP